MSIVFDNQVMYNINEMQYFYELPEHEITVRMLCEYALSYNMNSTTNDRRVIMDMMSYMYGVHENIAIYGTDQYQKRRSLIEMENFDKSINILDEINDNEIDAFLDVALINMASESTPLDYSVQSETSTTPINSSPICIRDNNADVLPPVPGAPMRPPALVRQYAGIYDNDDDSNDNTRPNVVRRLCL